MPLPRARTVAVVGAGPAGLVAARELRREGHEVTVFEKSGRVGGTWAYDPRADSDPVGLDPAREVVHGSMYASLRTNVPRDLMGFSGFALADRVYAGDPRPFPGHQEVLAFLVAFAEEADVAQLVRLRAEVLRLATVGQGDTWRVTWRGKGGAVEEEVFDAVVVCSGNCTIPRVPKIQGIDKWPGKQMHSHNYRTPELFQHQVVVIVGTGPSGVDIGTEICDVAKEVHVACRYPDGPIRKIEMIQNVWKHGEVSCVQDDGMVCFTEGSSVAADAILYCTGYEYHFPFLDADVVAVDDNRVEPLYKQVFPPKYAPSLSFIGLQRKAITFSLYELQSKWVASVLSRKAALPSEEDMLAAIDEDYRRIEENGKPKRHTHWLLTHTERVQYTNWFAGEVGAPPLEDWMYEMFENIVSGIWSVNSGPWV